MNLRDGTPTQRGLFAALVAVPLLGLGLAVSDTLRRVGQPNVGWMMDENYVSPTRRDSSEAGLRGGGLALRINGKEVPQDLHMRGVPPGVRTEIGATNTLDRSAALSGAEHELTFTVQPWTWHEVRVHRAGPPT